MAVFLQKSQINPLGSVCDRIAVTDTSFYVGLSQQSIWAKCALSFIKREGIHIVYPVTIRAEYEELYIGKETDSFGFPKAAMDPETFFGEFKFRISLIDGDVHHLSIVNYNHFAAKSRRGCKLGYRDSTILDYVIQSARTQKEVFAVTADSDIFQPLEGMIKNDNLENVSVLSPREVLEQELPTYFVEKESQKHLNCLILPDSLAKVRDAKSPLQYLVFSKQHEITPDFRCDLAIDVIEKTFGRRIDLPEGLYLAPIVSTTRKKLTNKKYNFVRERPGYPRYVLYQTDRGFISVIQSVGKYSLSYELLCTARIEPFHLSLQGRISLAELKQELTKAL